jgi:hypothetical protein
MSKVETRIRMKRKQEGQREEKWVQGNKARKCERKTGRQAVRKK